MPRLFALATRGRNRAKRDAVLLNAAAALFIANRVKELDRRLGLGRRDSREWCRREQT